MMERFLRKVLGQHSPSSASASRDPASAVRQEIVMSVPHEHRETFLPKVQGIALTYDTLTSLFRDARREIRIFSPYIDATFTNLALLTQAPIRVLTTIRDKKQKSIGVVERCAASRNVVVRYIHETRNESHLYQLHAKMILSDDCAGYVGSANLTDASIHYNFELGFLILEEARVRTLARIFDYLFDHVGFPSKVA